MADVSTGSADGITKGGFINVTKGTFVMHGGSISGRSATYGGAIYVGKNCVVVLNDVKIENCTADAGGAVYVDEGGTLIITGEQASIANCNSFAIMLAQSATARIYGGTIDNCSGNYGGAVHMETGSNLILNGGTIQNCTATFGAVAYCLGTITINGGKIDNCSAESGGAINADSSNTYDSYVNINGGQIVNCTSTQHGGAICINRANLVINDGEILNCKAADGGGLLITNGQCIIRGGNIKGCSASNDGGGIYANTNAKLTISGGVIGDDSSSSQPSQSSFGNYAAKSGAGIFARSCNLTITGGTIARNYAKGQNDIGGCAIYSHAAIIVISAGSFKYNSGFGGAFKFDTGTYCMITAGNFVGNTYGSSLLIHNKGKCIINRSNTEYLTIDNYTISDEGGRIIEI